ncbi:MULTISPECIES: glycoside hydrolase family 38 C-terminal domain-containing protein [unclassified Devosia]|uniref:alpha-mannosidase n=1 Tax=unclassified Devosia TaxID=196773 RepID=UPI000712E40B|nr:MULTISPECIES: glycoside hydrolase family 38 C-terminal domain-containing protein [unclassified Devosia]KQN69677.1 alpha-mannosidase [Devosia sp. Leaf64]KQT45792.1 alpha-mannosidase [Devosia sp. Leaf420]
MPRIAKLDRLLAVLRERIFQRSGIFVPLKHRQAENGERNLAALEDRSEWTDVDQNLVWGEPDGYYWFGGSVTLPQEMAGKPVFGRVEAQFGSVMGRSDPQLLVRLNGKIASGGDGNHREFRITSKATGGETIDILIEAGTIENRRQLGFAVELVTLDRLAEIVYYDLKVPLDIARLLKPDDARRARLLRHIDEAVDLIDLRPGNPERFTASLEAARTRADALYAEADADAMPEIVATGHTHIDVAWLWRVRETRQKMARSMANALSLMDEYDDYRFMYNQGVLLDYLEEDYPELFTRIESQVEAGRFEIEGALWLEPDVVIASGESLVRHITKGVKYHQDKFGVTPKIVWLPDTFGYTAALPQLMALAGLEVFITHKMSWNDTNRMPHEIFFWQGLDGTKVPAYFLTTQRYEYDGINTTYCPDLVPSHVMGTWKRFSQQGLHDELFLVYGHGDGGGGPTRGMLENVRRMERGIPGCPKIKHEPMAPYFKRLVERMNREPEAFPSWVGELYLEYHRGTLTSVAKNKRNNRLAEQTLHDLEVLAVLASRHGIAYPKDTLERLWKTVLLNQFHDILPGTSIGFVYEDSDRDYAAFFAEAAALRDQLAAPLATAGTYTVLNSTSLTRTDLLTLPAGTSAIAVSGETITAQTITRADGSTETVAPSAGFAPLSATALTFTEATASAPETTLSVSPTHLENPTLRATFNTRGQLTSLFDKIRNREALQPGKLGNSFVAHRDIPIDFDAWDIDDYVEDQSWPVDTLVSANVVETGPWRAAIRFEWTYENSRIVQVISLAADAAQLEFDTMIDWHEHQTLLKTGFPLAIRTDVSRAETQFGHLTRPTHANTSWDKARFETSMHRWVDLSEAGFGVAALNDCKYGYDAKGSTLRLTLVKSPVFPWPEADQGEHRLRYALLVHAGDLQTVHNAATAFNQPLRLLAGSATAAPTLTSLATLSSDQIAIETVKQSEDGQRTVLRLWETQNKAGTVTLTLPNATRISETDLYEADTSTLAESAKTIDLTFKPFEIKTIALG